jgi:hypothetical protein
MEATDTTIHIAPSNYSIRKTFHIEGSNSYPDSLAAMYPNPFNHNGGDVYDTLVFTVRDTGNVTIVIQNPLGDSVAIFSDSTLFPGSYTGTWDPVSSNGTRLRPGLYFITMHTANYVNSRLLDILSND